MKRINYKPRGRKRLVKVTQDRWGNDVPHYWQGRTRRGTTDEAKTKAGFPYQQAHVMPVEDGEKALMVPKTRMPVPLSRIERWQRDRRVRALVDLRARRTA